MRLAILQKLKELRPRQDAKISLGDAGNVWNHGLIGKVELPKDCVSRLPVELVKAFGVNRQELHFTEKPSILKITDNGLSARFQSVVVLPLASSGVVKAANRIAALKFTASLVNSGHYLGGRDDLFVSFQARLFFKEVAHPETEVANGCAVKTSASFGLDEHERHIQIAGPVRLLL